jgi:cbb3-type cytochrome oxidase cytochrome c subunit
MDNDILRKAIFLVRDCHESEQQAVEGLKTYFPHLHLGDRERYVSEACDMIHGIHPATP